MATLIGTVLLLVLSYYAYRAGLRLLGDERARKPLLDDRPGRGPDGLPDVGPDTPAETREHELADQVIAGLIDPADYRREMSELARRDESRSGDPR